MILGLCFFHVCAFSQIKTVVTLLMMYGCSQFGEKGPRLVVSCLCMPQFECVWLRLALVLSVVVHGLVEGGASTPMLSLGYVGVG